jgi:hypothetical protein
MRTLRWRGAVRLNPDGAFAMAFQGARKQRNIIIQEALGFESGYRRTWTRIIERAMTYPSQQTILSISATPNMPAARLEEARVPASCQGADPGSMGSLPSERLRILKKAGKREKSY